MRLLKEPTRRIRFLTQDQAAVLLKELPEHLRDMATFTLVTGLRAANVMGLTWEQVDLSRKLAWIHPDQAKARRAIAVPLNEAAAAVVARQVGRHPERVFTYQGQPVKQVSTKAWHKALARAGIENFRWHDLRHTWPPSTCLSTRAAWARIGHSHPVARVPVFIDSTLTC